MDMALDDVIASRPKRTATRPARGGRRGSARAEVLGKAPASPSARARAAAAAPAPNATPVAQSAQKIIVSNLPQDVNEAQIKELFSTTVGPLREVNLSYDSNGKSKGVAQVLFQRNGDGNKAFQQYNNRLIDGKRPMKIEIIVDPSRLAPQPLASRVAPAAAPAAATGATRGRGAPRGGPAGRGRGAGRRKAERTPKSAADLDAEMEDYTATNAPTTAAPAATAAA